MRTKRILFCLLLCIYIIPSFASNIIKRTEAFAEKDGAKLMLDIYQSDDAENNSPQPCLIFVFGGGFKEGERDADDYLHYFNYFAERNITVVSIDYRLGMKGQKSPGLFNTQPIQDAISMAVEDLYSATNYLINIADELNIDTKKFIINGSSAGAITVLQADYMDKNNFAISEVLPKDFDYAGVISFAGAIFSNEGVPSYRQKPAPTLFFHGTADKLVPYNKLRLFNMGMFGSKSIAKRFRKEKYPYIFYKMDGLGHEVANFPMTEFTAEVEEFIRDLVLDNKQVMIDIEYDDLTRVRPKPTTPGDYYN